MSEEKKPKSNVLQGNFQRKKPGKQTFDDSAKVSRELGAWNRMCIWRNICADYGYEAAKSYLSQFSSAEKKDIETVLQRIIDKGEEQTRKDVMGKVKFLGEC